MNTFPRASHFVVALAALVVFAAFNALPDEEITQLTEAFSADKSQAVPLPPSAALDVGFSPDGSAESLVLRTLRSAKHSIRLAAYSFTSDEIARALMDAHDVRHVDVQLVVDHDWNLMQDASHHARDLLSLLARHGIDVRVVAAYPLLHDKYAVVDGLNVQTGSFNYTRSAARRNAENALVVLNAPALASRYLADWTRLHNEGKPWE